MYYAPNMYIISKVTIHLMSREKVKGGIIEVNDSSLLISKGDSNYKSISISEIHSVRIKRNGVVKGLGYGVIIGGILGYGIGYITYNDDSYDEDPPEQEIRGWAGAIIGAVPGAAVGSIIGGIFTKRNFRINGNMKKLQKMFETIQRAER
jgi:hypothetical protein